MTTELEARLRTHFAGEAFQPRTGWEQEVGREARRPEVTAGRPSSSPPGHARVRLLGAGALAAAAALAVVTSLPVAAGADVPAWVAGLRTAVHIDSASGGSATSWGSTMTVVGGYLDAERTIVVLRRGDAGGAVPNASLVAAGRRYDMVQAVVSADGYVAVLFPPLPAAASAAIPVTLRLADGPTVPPHLWTLAFRLGPATPGTSSVPQPGRAGEMAVTFERVSVSAGVLAYRFTESGVAYDDVLGPVRTSSGPGGVQATARGPIAVHVQVLDGAGRPQRWLDTQITASGDGSVTFSEVTLLSGPGRYRIVITAPSGATLERTVVVSR